MQEGCRLAEIALGGAEGDFEKLGDLLHRVPAEVAQLDDLGLPRVQGGEAVQGVVQRQEVEALAGKVIKDLVQWQPLAASAALVGTAAAGMVN